MLGMKLTGQMNPAQILTCVCMVTGLIGGGYWFVFEQGQQAKDAARESAATQKQILDLGTQVGNVETRLTKALAEAATTQAKALSDQAVSSAKDAANQQAALANLAGKVDAYGLAQQALGSQVERLTDRVGRVEDDQKGDRADRVTFQGDIDRRVNSLSERTRVLECMRGGKC